MCCRPRRILASAALLLAACLPVVRGAEVLAPRVSATNASVRIMAANLNGNSQSYEDFALRIFQGLKPDVVAIQEFNYLGNSAGELRTLVNTAFGTNFFYHRESGYSIPNGIISRWPIRAAGSWEDVDTGVNDRGFAWARIDLPGTNDLVVVSIHLKASAGSAEETRRASEAAAIKALVQQNFPSDPWIVVSGDCNIQNTSEAALATFKTFLSDAPIPTDGTVNNDADTNNGRNERYDYVFPSFSLSTNRIATVIGSRTFPNGLVFDSRIYMPLGEVAPVQATDSGNAQHMAVLKDFRVSYTVTNFVPVPPPVLATRRDERRALVGLEQSQLHRADQQRAGQLAVRRNRFLHDDEYFVHEFSRPAQAELLPRGVSVGPCRKGTAPLLKPLRPARVVTIPPGGTVQAIHTVTPRSRRGGRLARNCL